MEPLKIVKYPHPVLTFDSKPIRRINQHLRDTIQEMFALMYEFEGVGLAANQVAIPYQFLVMNPTGDPEQKESEYAFINPVIRRKRGKATENEGCLSFPDLRIEIQRADEIDFQAVTLDGELRDYTWKGFAARIVQHETDHLHGHCFYERAGVGLKIEQLDILNSLETIYESDRKLGFASPENGFGDLIEVWEKEQDA